MIGVDCTVTVLEDDGSIRYDRLDLYFGIDPAQLLSGGDRLGESSRDVPLIEKNLPLQVAALNKVAIHEPDVAHSGPNCGAGNHCA